MFRVPNAGHNQNMMTADVAPENAADKRLGNETNEQICMN